MVLLRLCRCHGTDWRCRITGILFKPSTIQYLLVSAAFLRRHARFLPRFGTQRRRLSETLLRRALDALDAKIKTLHNCAYATVAGSPNACEAHATALEAKRVQLAGQLAQAPTPSGWPQIQHGTETLRHDVWELL